MSFKAKIKLASIVAIESVCGASHLVNSYVQDSIEWTEKKLINKLEPERSELDIVKERRFYTSETKKKIKQEFERIKQDLKDLSSFDYGSADEVMNETEEFGNA